MKLPQILNFIQNTKYQIQNTTLKIPNTKYLQQGFIKLSKHTLISYLIVSTVFVGTGIIFLFNPFGGIKQAEAAWFNDNWAYRQEIPVTTHSAAENNVYLQATFDTEPLTSTGKAQADCGDLRFTKQNGEILPYQNITGCSESGGATGDITIEDNADANGEFEHNQHGIVWTNAYTGYVFYINGATTSPVYKKTTDGGQTWGSQVAINGTTAGGNISIWYDRWTPTDTGTKIHIVFRNDSTNTLKYSSLDTSTDTLGTIYTIHTQSVTQPWGWNGNRFSITKSKGGYLFVISREEVGATTAFERSTDGGQTWTTRASFIEDGEDREMLLPGNDTDTNDIAVVQLDDSADTMYYAMYDDSANSWGTKKTIGSLEATDYCDNCWGMDVTVRNSDGKGIVSWWTAIDNAGADLKVAELTLTSAGTATVLTDVLTNSDNSGETGIFIDNNSGHIYVSYLKSTSAITWATGTTKNVYYKKSTDGGTTWGTETQFNTTADNLLTVSAGFGIANGDSGRFMPVWFNATLNDFITNFSNSILIGSSTVRIGFDTMPAAPFNIYMYYGNPEAANGSVTLTEAACSNTCTAGAFGSEVKGPSPTLYWKFNDGQGTNAEDSTTNALDGTIAGPTWQTEDQCVAGKCLYFDGVAGNNDNVSRADDAKLDFVAADNFTVSAWVKRNGAASADTYIINKATGATYTGYKLYMDASGDFCFSIRDGTNAEDSACTSAVEFDDDKWHFVTGVKAGTTSITLFVDGNQRAQDAAIASTGTLANTGTFYTGASHDGTNVVNEWLGFIDEVKVFRDQTARTAAQVLADYNARGNPEGVSQQQGNNIQNMPGVLSNGLVGYWKADESSGDAADSSGNAATLTNTAVATYTASKFANGAEMNGTTQYLSRADTAPLSVTGSLTLAAWIEPDDVLGSEDIIAKWDGANESYLLAKEAGEVRMYIDSASNYQATTGTPLAANTKAHVVGVYNASNATVKIYVNGVEAASSTTGTIPSSIGDDGGKFHLGAEDSTTTAANFFDGHIDEARVYNRALSNNEVSQLYNWAPGPVGYWKLDEGSWTNNCSTDTVFDSSGNGTNGDACPNSTGPTGGAIGKYGKAGDFDGSNDYVNLGTGYNLTSEMTISTWIKFDTVNSNYRDILTKMNGSGCNSTFEFGIDNGNFLYLSWTNDACGYESWQATGFTPVVNTWYHITATRNAALDTVYIYVNGTRYSTSLAPSTGDVSIHTGGASPVSIGRAGDFNGQYFDGIIDDLKLYNYQRTGAQAIEDMNAGHPAPGSPVGTPVGYWKFNEGANDMCSGGSNDVCNSGNAGINLDGTSTATRSNAGKFGRALDFNGTTSVINAGSDSSIDNLPTTGMTLSAWIYPETTGENGAGFIMAKNVGVSQNAGWIFSITGTNALQFIVDGSTDLVRITPSNAITLNAWNHVIVSWDGVITTAATADIYVNGKEASYVTTTDGASRVDDATSSLFIGNDSTGGARTFDGVIDEVKVYNQALNQSQILLDMNQGSAQVLGALSDNSTAGQVQAASQEYCVPGDSTTCTAPVGRWDFEEGTGITARDTSTLGNDLTLTNSPSYGIGKAGKGITFTSSTTDNDHLLRADDPDFDFVAGDSFTLEGWIKLNTLTTDNQYIISKYNEAGYKLHYNGTNGFVACSLDYDSTWTPTDASSTADNVLVDTNWHHVACVKNSNSSLTVFFDGKPGSAPDTSLTNSTLANTGSLNMGIDSSGTGAGTTGDLPASVDSFRIFNYARTPAQIAWNYNQGKPLAHWKMDECQGTTINDSAGNSLTGTLTIGATGSNTSVGTCTGASTEAWKNGVTGKLNYSMSVDGTDDYIEVADDAKLDFNDADFSIAGWFYRDTFTTDDVIIAKRNGIAANPPDIGYIVYIDDTTDKLTFEVCDTTPTTCDEYQLESVSTFTSTGWNHFVIVWDDDSAANTEIYINGLDNDATDTGTIGSVGDLSNAVALRHASESDGANYFDGQLDDLKIFNYALTATQAKILYRDGTARFGPTTGAP